MFSTEAVRQVKQLVEQKNSFSPETAKRASVAALPLASWVTANVQYASVLERIAPLEEEEQQLRKGLRAAELQVETLGGEICGISGKVEKLRKKFSEKTQEAEKVAAKMGETEATLKRAGKLIGDLQKEKKRWEKTCKDIVDKAKKLPISSLLSASHIIFLSSKTETERATIFQQWKQDRVKKSSFYGYFFRKF